MGCSVVCINFLLVKRLMLCEDVTRTSCGGILFVGSIAPPIHLSTLDGPPSALLPPYKLSSKHKLHMYVVCHNIMIVMCDSHVMVM